MNLLILEDNPAYQRQLENMLHSISGLQITFAETLEVAQTYLDVSSPALLITEVYLPDGEVFCMLRKIKPSFPIIFITEDTQPDNLDLSLSISQQSILLIKPFHPLTLLGIVRKFLGLYPSINVVNSFLIYDKFKNLKALPFSEIHYIKAEGNYITVRTNEGSYTMKYSLKRALDVLDERFIQIHKGYLANLDYFNRLNLSLNQIIIHQHPLPVGRSFRKNVIERIC
ncbi:LytR/AlgR family response regulator transcription factor [Arundinibacter roseus]|uniref:Response regulator n=1 Tax=Arundinibacter roseus TaxID=2070510 RepID=A0A4R4JYF7_9BACT|nr:LytTR family DNA-binding domain-containing protein [Arundinibacter roseus]TDB58689.1 response regulator [Arundinibacter roseus]